MSELLQFEETIDHQLQQHQHAGDDERAQDGIVLCQSAAEHVLRHSQLVCLEEEEPAEGEQDKFTYTMPQTVEMRGNNI